MARLTPAARTALAQERRQQIAQAALEVFSERGYEQATVREIARRAGLAEGTVYLYFRSKQDLLVAVWESLALSQIRASLRRAEAVRPGTEEEALAAILQEQFQTLLQHGAFFRLVMHRADVDPEFLRRARVRIQEFQEEVAGLLWRLVQRGTLARLDPDVVVRCLGALIRGLVLFDRYDPKPLFDRYPVEVVAREVARFVLYGLLPRESKSLRGSDVRRRGGRR